MLLNGSVNPPKVLGALPSFDGDVRIDLSMARFVEPVGLVGIAAVVESALKAGRTVTISPPQDPNVRNYLSRMGLGDVLESFGVEHDLPVVNRNNLQTELLELSKFSGGTGGETLAQLVFDKLDGSGTDAQVLDTLHSAICELAGNVEWHAQVENGYVAAQTVNRGTKIIFAVADAGRGLKASLESNPTLAITDDANAIALAVQPNISATGERGRGQGLSDVVTSATGLGGTVHLASGKSRAVHSSGHVYTESFPGTFAGTIIQVELDCVPGK